MMSLRSSSSPRWFGYCSRAPKTSALAACRRADDQLETEKAGAGFDHIDGLRKQAASTKKAFDGILETRRAIGHRFGCSCGFVQQRGVGQLQPVRSMIICW